METGLIVYRAGVRSGRVLPVSQTVDVAPTITRLLGLDLPDAGGTDVPGLLAEK